MTKTTFSLCILVAILVMSCANSDACQEIQAFNLEVESGSIRIKLDSTQGYYHGASEIVEINDSLMYFGLDSRNSRIDIYNLDKASFSRSIRLETEGPDKIKHYGKLSLKVIASDSIVLLTPYKDFYIVNMAGKVLFHKRLSFENYGFDKPYQSLDFFSMGVSEYANSPLTLDNNGNIYTALLWSDDYYHTTNFWKEYRLPPFVGIPISSPDSMFFVGQYPSVGGQSALPRSIMNSIAFDNQGKYVIQFDSFHNFYREDSGIVCQKIIPFNGAITTYRKSKVISEEEELAAFISDPAYVALKYDDINNVFYRFLKQYQEYKDEKGKVNRRLSADFSIQVFDTNLEYTGQIDFAGGEYDFIKPHVKQGQVFLSKETIANQNDRESYLEFDVLKIKFL